MFAFSTENDDAIAVDCVAKLRQTAEDYRAYLARHRHPRVDFNHSFIGRPDVKGFQAKSFFKTLWGAALAMAVMPEGRQTVKNFQHNKMEFMPTVTRNDPDMFVRCHGEFSSSYKKYAKQATHLDHLDAAEEVLF